MEEVRMRTDEAGDIYLIGISINGFWRNREFFVRCTSLSSALGKIRKGEKKAQTWKVSACQQKIHRLLIWGRERALGNTMSCRSPMNARQDTQILLGILGENWHSCATFPCGAGIAVTAHRGGLNSRGPRPSSDHKRPSWPGWHES